MRKYQVRETDQGFIGIGLAEMGELPRETTLHLPFGEADEAAGVGQRA
ncbi:MAG: hypothetical protein ACI39C_07510 [Dietzia sp.]